MEGEVTYGRYKRLIKNSISRGSLPLYLCEVEARVEDMEVGK